jgi:hypothetical protein
MSVAKPDRDLKQVAAEASPLSSAILTIPPISVLQGTRRVKPLHNLLTLLPPAELPDCTSCQIQT